MIGSIVVLAQSIVRVKLKVKSTTEGVPKPINFVVMSTPKSGKKQARNIASMYSEVFTDFPNLFTLNLSSNAETCSCE